MNLSKLGWAVSRIGLYLLAGTLFLPGLAWAQGATVGQSADQDAPLATGAGIFKKAAFFSLNNQLSNASNVAFVDAFNVAVATAGAGTQCVLVHYSGEIAELAAVEGVSAAFRTLLDGAVMEGHNAGGIEFVSPDGNAVGRFEMLAFHHWKCGIAAGVHTIQVQMRTDLAGQTVFVRGRTLTVQFKK